MAVKFEKTGDGAYMLDVQGYVCPHPQLYTKKGLEKLKQGEILEVVFDNPSSGESIVAMCQAEGQRDRLAGKGSRKTYDALAHPQELDHPQKELR